MNCWPAATGPATGPYPVEVQRSGFQRYRRDHLTHGPGWKLRSEPQVGAEVENAAEGQLAHPAGQGEGSALIDPMHTVGRDLDCGPSVVDFSLHS